MRFASATFLSLLAHGVLAALLTIYVDCTPSPNALAQLDLSSVELSFADTEDDSAAAIPSSASAPAAQEQPEARPPEPPRPPEIEPPPKERPPEPESMKIQDPKIEPPPMETPPKETAQMETPPNETPPKETTPMPQTAAAAPRQAKIDAPPRPRRSIRPDYPKGARQRGEHGDVKLEIAVSASGFVSDAKVIASSGYQELDEAAVKAVKSAIFTPARRDGRPVASSAVLTLDFRLR